MMDRAAEDFRVSQGWFRLATIEIDRLVLGPVNEVHRFQVQVRRLCARASRCQPAMWLERRSRFERRFWDRMQLVQLGGPGTRTVLGVERCRGSDHVTAARTDLLGKTCAGG